MPSRTPRRRESDRGRDGDIGSIEIREIESTDRLLVQQGAGLAQDGHELGRTASEVDLDLDEGQGLLGLVTGFQGLDVESLALEVLNGVVRDDDAEGAGGVAEAVLDSREIAEEELGVLDGVGVRRHGSFLSMGL